MTKRRLIPWLAGLGGLCVLLLFAFVLLLPRFVDGQAMREAIRSFVATRANGNVAIEKIDLTWFPRPAIVVSGAALVFTDKVSAKIPSIKIYPSLRGLLTGRLQIARLEAASPALSVHLAEPTEVPFDMDGVEGQIRSLLASLAEETPGLSVIIRSGSAEFQIGDRPPLAITNLDGRLTAPPGALRLQISSRSNIFDSLRVNGQIANGTLATQGQVKIDRLRLKESMASLVPRLNEYVESGEASLNVGIAGAGLKKIRTEIDGTLPSLGLVRGERKAVIEGGALKAVISRDDGMINAAVERLDLVSPPVNVIGESTIDPASSTTQLKLTGHNLNIAPIREWALKIAGDVGAVENLFRHVKAGKMPEISIQTAGGSFAEMSDNLRVAGTLGDGHIFAVALDSDLENVNGSFVVSGGILEAREFFARVGKTQGRDGSLRLGLEGKSAPFHLDVMVQADAAELHSWMLRVIKNDALRNELSRVRNLEGDLSGRLILGERIDDFLPKISISKAAVRGYYDSIEYPLSVTEGRFEYGDGKIALNSVSGAVGLSTFSGLTGSLNYSESRRVEVSSAKFSLDLAQAKNLLDRFELLREELSNIDFARGKLDVTSLSLKGLLDDPGGWDFTSAGTLGKIAVKHAELPAVMNLSGGKFNAMPAKFAVSNAKVNLLDAALTVDGSLEKPAKAPLSLAGTATGTIGPQMAAWLSRQLALPKQYMLRAPLQLAKGQLLWKKDGDTAFIGDVTVAGGPRISLDIVRAPQTIEVKELLVADGARRARMTLNLKKDTFAFSFNGTLDQQILNRTFQVPPLEGSLIQGDIEISAFFEAPVRFTARGRVSGRGFRVPLKDESALVEFFFLEADQAGVHIRSADLRWRNSRLSAMGTLLAKTQALRLDMDVSADRIVWEEISEILDGEAARGKNGKSPRIPPPPLEGTVRLKADDLSLAGFSWSPFQATASLSPNGIRSEIERADVCGVSTAGRVDFTDGEIGLDLTLSVTDGQLERTSLCLTENRHGLTGSFSFNGRLIGRGTPEKVLQSLRGEFEFNARDGQFPRSPNVDTALEATFDYLNEKGDFNLAFPDLDKESFPFQSLRIRGTVDGLTLVNDALVLQSTLYIITGDGKVDLERQHIDAKGLVTVRIPGDAIIRRIPLVGSILGIGGSILGIPVRVAGPLEHPTVTYLSPADVGTELLNIPVRILGLPLEALRLFTPNFGESGTR